MEVETEQQEAETAETAPNEPQAPEKKTVPLETYLSERKKRQEAQIEADWHKQQSLNAQKVSASTEPEEEDEYQRDLKRVKTEAKTEIRQERFAEKRIEQEREWQDENPEKTLFVDQNVDKFLKQNPHLAKAIDAIPNRYSETYKLMDALTPKAKKDLERPEKAPAPNSTGAVPKSAALRKTEDVMSMSDKEFREWRSSKRKVR